MAGLWHLLASLLVSVAGISDSDLFCVVPKVIDPLGVAAPLLHSIPEKNPNGALGTGNQITL